MPNGCVYGEVTTFVLQYQLHMVRMRMMSMIPVSSTLGVEAESDFPKPAKITILIR